MENMMKMETFRNQEFGSVRIIRDDGRLLFAVLMLPLLWATRIPARH